MDISNERKEKIEKESFKTVIKNQRVKDKFQYTVPAPTTYPYQWLWDSCFHAIVLSNFNIEDAKKEIHSVLSHQLENGMLPHMIYWEEGGVIQIKWGLGDTSSITQPPIIAEAVWQIYKQDNDKVFLEKVYPNLYHFYNYLLTERDPRRNNLIGIINPDESGEDNSPRFDEFLELGPKQSLKDNLKKRKELVSKLLSCKFDAPFCMKNFFWVEDVPFNSIMVRNLDILSEIAEELGYKEASLDFKEHSISITNSMREKMVSDGIFYSVHGEDYKKIKVKTWAMFSPLYSKILSKDEARKLVDEHLFNDKEFWSPNGIRTVSCDEGSYDPEGFWRGPVWVSVHWFIFKGLINYDMNVEADRVLEKTIVLLEKSGFREYFNPETGEGLGANNFTWGALVTDMIKLSNGRRSN